MKFVFKGKRIRGILAVIPERERSFVDEMRNFRFPEARSLKLMQVMGYDKHRMVQPGVCVSDLAVFALEHLFKIGVLKAEEIDALVLVTQSPDYFMPPTSNVIQGRLGLKRDVVCMDINQGCAGFIIGLIQAFMLLEQDAVRRVVVINADVLSRKTSQWDRNSYPLIGDAASITVVERQESDSRIDAEIRMDGTRNEALMIPAGGFRLPCSAETALLEDAGDNNLRSKDHLRMDGSAVFNFVQTEVPGIIADLLSSSGKSVDDIDYLVCHQPNRFMLQKLADKIKIPHVKVPMNVVEKFGNSSGVTIPIAIVTNLVDQLKERDLQICFAGFGVGLTWGAMLMRLGNMEFCSLTNFPDKS